MLCLMEISSFCTGNTPSSAASPFTVTACTLGLFYAWHACTGHLFMDTAFVANFASGFPETKGERDRLSACSSKAGEPHLDRRRGRNMDITGIAVATWY